MELKAKPAPLFKRKRRKERRLLDRLRALAGLKFSTFIDPPPSNLGLAS
jgi:hypothetical protein